MPCLQRNGPELAHLIQNDRISERRESGSRLSTLNCVSTRVLARGGRVLYVRRK